MITTQDLEFTQIVLPSHYQCSIKANGILCESTIGICDDHMTHDRYNPETDDHWMLITKAMRQKWGERLLEINSIEPQTHSVIKIYLK